LPVSSPDKGGEAEATVISYVNIDFNSNDV